MKKLLHIIGILALVSFAFTSCQTTQNVGGVNDDQFFTRSDAANQREQERIAREQAVAEAEARLRQREAEAAARRQQQQAQQAQQQEFHYFYEEPVVRGLSMEDYHDFMFSSRIRRFHSGFFMPSYFDNFYTNMFFFNGNPMYFGTSIHFGTSWWVPRSRWGFYWRPTWVHPSWHWGHHHAWGWGPSWHWHHPHCMWHRRPFHRPCDWAFYRWNYNFFDRNTVRFREFQPRPRPGGSGLPTNNVRPSTGRGAVAGQNVGGTSSRPTRGGDFVTNYENAVRESGGRPTRGGGVAPATTPTTQQGRPTRGGEVGRQETPGVAQPQQTRPATRGSGGQQEVSSFPQNNRPQPATQGTTTRPGTGRNETATQQRPAQNTQQRPAQQNTQQGQTQQSTTRRYQPTTTPSSRSSSEFSSPASRQQQSGNTRQQNVSRPAQGGSNQPATPPSSNVSRPTSGGGSSGSGGGTSSGGGSSRGGGGGGGTRR